MVAIESDKEVSVMITQLHPLTVHVKQAASLKKTVKIKNIITTCIPVCRLSRDTTATDVRG